MLQALVAAGASMVIAILAPYILLDTQKAEGFEDLIFITEEYKCSDSSILLRSDDGIKEMLLEDYLVGVVFAEMPMSFHEEALKSQAVAARTFAYRQKEQGKHQEYDVCSDHTCCQAWMSENYARDKLGEDYMQYWQNAQKAVKDTTGEVMTFGGRLIEAVYFSCSGGSTEDAIAVWGSNVPYLRSVQSRGEEDAPVFESEKRVPCDEFKKRMAEEGIVLNADAETWISAIEHTSGGGVARICIGGRWLAGMEVRRIFDLNSARFLVQVEGDVIVFQVYGYGHRVGLSQYGANAMANGGADHFAILEHYYTGVRIEHIENRSSP